MVVAAQIRIPLPWTPVPITLQTMIVYLGAAWLGSSRAVSGILIYAGLAAVGLPVLSGWQGGLAAFTGPTGGYVVGMILAAFLLGRYLGGRPASLARTATLMAAAAALIFTCGLLHFVLFMRVPIEQALWMALWPFLPGEALKLTLAAAVYRSRPNPMASR
jgi:biotin transport system substrate-specific component